MRPGALAVVAVLGLFLGTGVAAAEKVRTNQSTKLLARPGEQAKVLLVVKSGQNMTLLNREGQRWLKVRVQGRTGFVPRSKVDMADDGGIARNTRRRPFVDGRGKRRGFGGEGAPDDRVGADALGDGGSGGGEDEGSDDEDEEEDEPAPKKTAAKAPPPKATASKSKDDDEEEEDDEEDAPPAKKTPAKAPPVKVAAAAKMTPPGKGKQEDDEEEEEEDEDAKPAAKGGGEDDEEEDDEEDKPAGKGGDDEDPIGGGTKDGEDEADKRPTAHVTSRKVSVREDPDDESEEQFVVGPSDMLYPMETKGNYTFVENAEGDGGWVPSDLLELEGSGGGGGPGKRVIDIRARAGLTIIQQGMRTTGSNVLTVPDNYNIGTSAATLALGAGILIPKGKWLLGGEFTYDYAKALGGGVPYDADGSGSMAPVNIGITLHNVNVRGLAGIDLKKKSGMSLIGHLGYRYQGFLVTDVANFTANPARLPSEVVKAPTLGAALAIPRLTEKIGIKFALDAIVFGASVKQTVGLEDGAAPSVKAVVVGTDFTYKITKSLDVMASYNLNYMAIDFGAPVMSSMRNHMGTNVTRTDIFHMITFGVSKPF